MNLDKKFTKANTNLGINDLFSDPKEISEPSLTSLNYDKIEEDLISKFVTIDLDKPETGESIDPKTIFHAQEAEATKDKPLSALLSAEVLEVFKDIGGLMTRYKSGKLPKPLRVIPMLSLFEKLLHYMDFKSWSAQGILAAFELWMPSMKTFRVELLYEKFLYAIIRKDFQANGKLGHHLYQLLIKSTYKPLGFLKCFVLRLVKEKTFTFKESAIYCGIIKKMSIHNTYASSLLMRLCDELSGCNHSPSWIVLKSFIEKKYHLPLIVIDKIAMLYASFIHFKLTPNVYFYQCLLSYAQMYKFSIKEDYVNGIKDMLDKHKHNINGSIKKELNAGLRNKQDQHAQTINIDHLKDNME